MFGQTDQSKCIALKNRSGGGEIRLIRRQSGEIRRDQAADAASSNSGAVKVAVDE